MPSLAAARARLLLAAAERAAAGGAAAAARPRHPDAAREEEEEGEDHDEEEEHAADRRHRLRPRVVVVRGEAPGCVARRAVATAGGGGARAWLNATPGCSSSSRWMYWGNFRFMPKTPVTTAPIPIVIEMAVAITSILRRRLRAESRL